ncbi:MAG: acetylglutamate kinase [Melioribacteraceae bacterium]
MNLAIVKISGKSLETFISSTIGASLINELKEKYSSVILIHGGGNLITEWSKKLGIESSFFEGQRITDSKGMEVTAAVQDGLINSKLTSYLQSNSIQSIGLNGIDMGLFKAEYLNDKLGFVGNPLPNQSYQWLETLLGNGIVPVFSSVCADGKGNLMNVNADLFAGAIAKLLKAETILFVSDLDGVMLNGEFQSSLSVDDVHEGLSTGEINGGMIPKMNTCLNLLSNGIKNIWIGNNFNEITNSESNLGTWIIG